MKYIVAVSGGVDSVVLLDMVAKIDGHEIIVAHFDHGIREESDADARFVAALANRYSLPFEQLREELGSQASELYARERRYLFLRMLANKHHARIMTAHHLDDLVETIVINSERGTGWRGLGVLSARDIERPLVGLSKSEIYEYALHHNLEWIEDTTNASDKYHRNRIRKRTQLLERASKELLANLRDEQIQLATQIDDETKRLLDLINDTRYFYQMINATEAIELLRARTNARLTRPQCVLLWMAIKTARPGKKLECGGGVTVSFSFDKFKVAML